LIVANSASSELRQFNADGTFIKASGRQGQGPGEFERIEAVLRLPGDTVVVLDQGAIKFFSPDGAFVRAGDVRVPRITQIQGPPLVMAIFPDGSRVLTGTALPPPRARGERWTDFRSVLLVDATNSVTRSLGTLPFMQYAMDNRPQRPWFGAQFTFANNAQSFYYGIGDQYSIMQFSSDGRLTRIIRRRWAPRQVTSADIDAYVKEWGKRWIRSSVAEAEARYADIRDDPYATTVPAFSQLVIDADERLWVREPQIADAAWAGQLYGVPLVSSTWSVFDRVGRWLCDVPMPSRFLVKEIGSDYVLGVARGDDDVETVVMYQLESGVRR
jgi:hypothetical protein